MLVLRHPIKLNKAAIESPNLCDDFDSDDLKNIGSECYEGYSRDEQSRATWVKRNEAGMDLALQISKEKSFPWPNCANVAFPLVTIAAMQFHARAYPALINGPDIVKCADFLIDPKRSERISTHMSWQLLFQDKTWEDQEDKALLNLSIVGCNFKKSYYSSTLGHNVSELVLAKHLVLDYWAKSVEGAMRKTHRIPKSRNEVYENVMRGLYVDILDEPWYQNPSQAKITQISTGEDNRQGIQPTRPDESTSLWFLEQHVNLDLDDDGYAEPYIITLEENSKTVVRIVTRFDSESAIERVKGGANDGKIIRIEATEYFTKKTFIPSPDGGIYDIGFGVFLGPLNESVNSLINILLDAGVLQNTSGGFIGRGAKIRGGVYTLSPFEWKRVDSTGDDLRKSMFQPTINQPSEVLFNLLNLLINYTNRISGSTDVMVGENPGQNTPAQTTQTMVEMGQKIYSAIFKRVWRASKSEFEKLFKLNGLFLADGKVYPGGAKREDYQAGADLVCPVADPSVTSDSQQLQRAITLKQAAATTPGYNKDLVEQQFLKALKVPDPEAIFPGGAEPPKDPKLVIEETKIQGKLAQQERELQAQMMEFQVTAQSERELNNAKILELQASAQEKAASAQTEAAYAQVALINAEIGRVKAENDKLDASMDTILRAVKLRFDRELGLKKATVKPASKT